MHKSTYEFLFLSFNIGWGSFFFGFMQSYFNEANKTMEVLLDIRGNDWLLGLINAMAPTGALIGAGLSGLILASNTRRRSLRIADLVGMVGTLMTLVQDYWFISIGRLVQGLCTGMNCVIILLFIRDFSPIKINGMCGIMHSV